MSRSGSKKKKNSPRKREISLMEGLCRPKLWGNSHTKSKNRKSHQGSYLIGADTATDWPLEPKYRGEPGVKLHGALRRK